MAHSLILGANESGQQSLLLGRMANRHGLIAGATGTGKTISLQVLAEQFSDLGVPVFLVDAKGDLSGLTSAGTEHPKISERIQKIGLQSHHFRGYPVQFWDVWGEDGTPVRTTIADLGPLLVSRLLELNDTQEGVINIAFAVAKDKNLPLLNLEDLRSLLIWLGDNTKEIGLQYGNVSSRSIGAIQRRLLSINEAGGDIFFGEPALELHAFMRTTSEARGIINILSGKKLVLNPTLYGIFLFWMLTELFETLPESGDLEVPKLVFFFDEAHLLFDSAPKALLDRVEQVVRLIRSKGVGIYFITQNPTDIPDDVLGQLGNRIQHALRAFTPRDQKAVKVAAETFRPNDNFDARLAITELGVGEALVSTLDAKGSPTPVERVLICPPQSKIGPIEAQRKLEIIQASPLQQTYKNPVDRESAHEMLKQRLSRKTEELKKASTSKQKPTSRKRQGYVETLGKSVLRTLGSQLGRTLIKTVMAAITGKRR